MRGVSFHRLQELKQRVNSHKKLSHNLTRNSPAPHSKTALVASGQRPDTHLRERHLRMKDHASSSHQSIFATASDRALVLHGGGAAGNAWEIGVIAGFYEAGLDLRQADLIIGTSAGATAAAQITGASPTTLFSQILDAPPPQANSANGGGARSPRDGTVNDHLARTNKIIADSLDAADMRRRMGAAALEFDDDSENTWQSRWHDIVASRLPSQKWPEQEVLITAVDAHTGEPMVFDKFSGVSLVDAVAASTSSGFAAPPYRIGKNKYIDGGYRRNENADLAKGFLRVLVLSPLGGRTRHPLEWGMQLAAQIAELRVTGSRVRTIFPDADSLSAFGSNLMDLSTRPPAARAGYAQGQALAGTLQDFWY